MTAVHPFDADTALTRLGDGSFEGQVTRRWWVGRGPHGGFIAALVLRALSEMVGDPGRAPRSLTLHYLAPPAEGPLRVEATIERSGRSLTSTSARLLQGDRLVGLALGAFSPPWPGEDHDAAPMPAVPAPEDLPTIGEGNGRPEFLANLDMRWAIGERPMSSAPDALVGGWVRTAQPRLGDALLMAMLSDAFPPAPFPRLSAPALAPTIDLTIHFRSPLPQDAAPEDFYLGRFISRLSSEGFFEEDGEIWSRDGRLLVQSRQLALLLPAPG